MGKLSKREKGLLVVLVIAVAGLLYYNFILKDFIETYGNIGTQIKDTETKIQDLRLKKSSITMIDEKIDDLSAECQVDSDRVLDFIDRPKIIMALNKTISPYGDNINYQFPMTYVTLQDNFVTTAEISFKSTVEDFEKILNSLRNLEYINKITNASVSSVDPVSGNSDIRMEVEILTKDIYPPVLD